MTDIVCIGIPKWEGNYAKSTVELLKELSKKHRILYIEYQYTLKDLLWGFKDKSIPVKKLLGIDRRIVEKDIEGRTIHVMTAPPLLPINWISSFALYLIGLRINSFILRKYIKKAISLLDFKNHSMVYAFTPFYAVHNINKFDESQNVYYCYDEIRESYWLKKHGGKVEELILPKVDKVIVTSDTLYSSRKSLAKNIYLIKNGVNYNVFARYFSEEIKAEKQVIGFVGSLDFRIDYNLLEHVVTLLPYTRFIFVGRVESLSEVESLKRFPNVELVPPQPYEHLPQIICNFSVGIIPFLINGFTKSIYPMKINEYFALGKPVVMTNFTILPEFSGEVGVANNPEQFINLIENEIKNNSSAKAIRRRQMAKANSWEKRAELFSRYLLN